MDVGRTVTEVKSRI